MISMSLFSSLNRMIFSYLNWETGVYDSYIATKQLYCRISCNNLAIPPSADEVTREPTSVANMNTVTREYQVLQMIAVSGCRPRDLNLNSAVL